MVEPLQAAPAAQRVPSATTATAGASAGLGLLEVQQPAAAATAETVSLREASFRTPDMPMLLGLALFSPHTQASLIALIALHCIALHCIALALRSLMQPGAGCLRSLSWTSAQR